MARHPKVKREYEDDGHTIVNMNVEGAPWYQEPPKEEGEVLSKEDARAVARASLKWVLLFTLGFSLLMVLFILFCTKVWFA